MSKIWHHSSGYPTGWMLALMFSILGAGFALGRCGDNTPGYAIMAMVFIILTVLILNFEKKLWHVECQYGYSDSPSPVSPPSPAPTSGVGHSGRFVKPS